MGTMKKLTFAKMQGAGNDFVLLDAVRRSLPVSSALARRLLDRHFGVGADQLLLLRHSPRADFRMDIFNADGSRAEMCGNGVRCAALYAKRRGLAKKPEMVGETAAVLVRPVLNGGSGRVDMGEPVFEAAKIPVRAKGRVIEAPFRFPGGKVRITCLSMGNPHAVIFVEDLEKTPVEK